MIRPMFLALLAIGFVAAKVLEPEYSTDFVADKEFLLKQKKVFQILYHLWQPELMPELYKMGQEFKIEEHSDYYTNKEAYKDFMHRMEHGFLPKDGLFSIFYPQMMEETRSIYNLMYYAKDFDSFYMTALYLRNRMNIPMFGYAFYLAVIHRPDTQYIRLPPIYEMAPFYFYNNELFEKVHHVKRFGKLEPKHSAGYDTYIIPYNYSGHYISHEYDYEQRLNYFTEDIGLSNFYAFLRSEYPFFLKSKELGSKSSYRGEEYLYSHKQLFNRYYLERLSNDLGLVEEYDYHNTFYAGYYPAMSYPNGLPYPVRPWETYFPKHKYHQIHRVEEFESRVSQVVDVGYVYTDEGKIINIHNEDGINILGNLLEGNADSLNPQFYGNIEGLTRNILGFNLDPLTPYKIQPSAMENFVTSMRDPAFWRMYYRIIEFYNRFRAVQKAYKPEEIQFPEYKIESMDMDKLVTYFDYFDSTISHGMMVDNEKEKDSFIVQARQYRLNHKHFNVHLNVKAEKAGKAAVRIFLGPKRNVHYKDVELSDYYKYFYQMDEFIYDMSAGMNKITRNCHDFFFIEDDPEPSEVFWKKLSKSIETGEEMKLQKRMFGFPLRLLLPRGKVEGMEYQIFVHVSPVNETMTYRSNIFGNAQVDKKPFGYPLDKPVSPYDFHGPNFYFKDVMIYHQQKHEMHVHF